MVRMTDFASSEASRGDRGKGEPVHLSFRQTIDESVQKLAIPLSESCRVHPGVVATVADLTDLQVTRAFGQAVSEQIVASLVQRGFKVRESRLRPGLAARGGSGESLLSREPRGIMHSDQQASWVVVGTYSVAARSVLVQLRVVSPSDGQIRSTASFELPLDADMRALLSDRSQAR
jgi:TolB-like protein